MSVVRRLTLPLSLAIAGSLGAMTSAHGQNVLVQVLAADTSQPLVGAVAHLLLPSGEVVASRLSDRNGRALFAGVAAGRYRVRAEMLGHTTGESSEFDVGAFASVPLAVRLEPRAIRLEGVEVTAEAGPCRMRPGDEGRLLADVWDEARKALSATAVAEDAGIYRYSLVTYDRELDADRAVLSEERGRQSGYMRTPFASQSVEDLTEHGFVQRDASEWTYYAPDAHVLLSDGFLDTHCFRLVDGGAEQAALVGLTFEPTGENEGLPDISGTLWLDRESVELRWLDLTYENLEPDVLPGDASGRVDFQRLPDGTWIVPEWWIRMPSVEVDAGRRDRRRIIGFHQTGGRVLETVAAGGRELRSGETTGAIEGIVVDTLGLPIQAARVGWIGSGQVSFTDAEGRFNLTNVPEGTYRVRVATAGLDSLGLEAPTITREVGRGVSAYVEVHIPSPAELLVALCEGELEPGTSALGGVVRHADTDEPLPGATVRVRWSSIRATGATIGVVAREEFTELRTTADERGGYRLCGVPRREELTLVASVDGEDGREQTLSLSDRQEAYLHVIRYRP